MKKRLYLVIPILTVASFFLFNWHLKSLPKLSTSEFSYFIHRLIMALWFVVPGFALEFPRLLPYVTGKTEARTDWWFLLINGVPAFFFAWLPFFVAVFHIHLPGLLLWERLPAESIGAFWLGITLGKSIVLKGNN